MAGSERVKTSADARRGSGGGCSRVVARVGGRAASVRVVQHPRRPARKARASRGNGWDAQQTREIAVRVRPASACRRARRDTCQASAAAKRRIARPCTRGAVSVVDARVTERRGRVVDATRLRRLRPGRIGARVRIVWCRAGQRVGWHLVGAGCVVHLRKLGCRSSSKAARASLPSLLHSQWQATQADRERTSRLG